MLSLIENRESFITHYQVLKSILKSSETLTMNYSISSGWYSCSKKFKTPFFQDIQNSFQWATGIGSEPHQKNFPKKIPTNTVARAVQSFGRNGPWLAG